MMSESGHDIVSLLYSVKGMIETHLARVEEGGFFRETERLWHAEEVLKRSYSKADSAIQITKRLRAVAEPENACRVFRVKTSVKSSWRKIARDLREKFPDSEIELKESRKNFRSFYAIEAIFTKSFFKSRKMAFRPCRRKQKRAIVRNWLSGPKNR